MDSLNPEIVRLPDWVLNEYRPEWPDKREANVYLKDEYLHFAQIMELLYRYHEWGPRMPTSVTHTKC